MKLLIEYGRTHLLSLLVLLLVFEVILLAAFWLLPDHVSLIGLTARIGDGILCFATDENIGPSNIPGLTR